MTRGESSGPDRHAQGAPRPQAKAHVPGGTEWSQHGKQLGPQTREQQGTPLLPQPPLAPWPSPPRVTMTLLPTLQPALLCRASVTGLSPTQSPWPLLLLHPILGEGWVREPVSS